MTKYELMFIIDPVLDDEKKEAVIETVKGIIAAAGEVAATDVWASKSLPILSRRRPRVTT